MLLSCLNLCQLSWRQSPNIKTRRAYSFFEFILYIDISFKVRLKLYVQFQKIYSDYLQIDCSTIKRQLFEVTLDWNLRQ